jgi:hypothetical protein
MRCWVSLQYLGIPRRKRRRKERKTTKIVVNHMKNRPFTHKVVKNTTNCLFGWYFVISSSPMLERWR